MANMADLLARHTGVKESHQILVDFMDEIKRRYDAAPKGFFGGDKAEHRQLLAAHSALAELGGLLTDHATEIYTKAAFAPVRVSKRTCEHKSAEPKCDHLECTACGSIKTDWGASWGAAAGGKWFRSVSEAKFYKDHGCLPDPIPANE
jgi:hypothetical protein